mgnify:CR=1 FL=1
MSLKSLVRAKWQWDHWNCRKIILLWILTFNFIGFAFAGGICGGHHQNDAKWVFYFSAFQLCWDFSLEQTHMYKKPWMLPRYPKMMTGNLNWRASSKFLIPRQDDSPSSRPHKMIFFRYLHWWTVYTYVTWGSKCLLVGMWLWRTAWHFGKRLDTL